MPTVLIVDDESSILDIASAILEKNGFTVETAASIEEAEKRLALEGIDAALIDIVFPGRGGVELLMRLRDERPELPVVIMTGKVRTDSEPFRQLVQQFGAKSILTKPFSSTELTAALRQVMGL